MMIKATHSTSYSYILMQYILNKLRYGMNLVASHTEVCFLDCLKLHLWIFTNLYTQPEIIKHA